MINDSVSDMITRIRNANLIKARYVYIPNTNLTLGITKILKSEGLIQAFEVGSKNENVGLNQDICIFLKYKGLKKIPYITKLKRISKPGIRVYVNRNNIPKVLSGIGIAIISTSKGLMTDRQARFEKMGGEVLCYIW